MGRRAYRAVSADGPVGRPSVGDVGRPRGTDYGDDRLPPGQRLVRDWPVLDLGLKPDVALEAWTLKVDGAVTNPIIWNWNDFIDQPQMDDVSDIHCVTSWSR